MQIIMTFKHHFGLLQWIIIIMILIQTNPVTNNNSKPVKKVLWLYMRYPVALQAVKSYVIS